MTDMWESEEVYIDDGLTIGFVETGGTVTLGACVKWGTSAQNKVVMVTCAADADSVGVATKAGATSDAIPVVFYGVCKMKAGAVITVGDMVEADVATAGNVQPIQTYTAGQLINYRGLNNTGTRCRLGIAMQKADATGDDLLILVGKFM